jgi:hypothetical protein
MACPYFFPVARFETSPWSIPPRLPLGDAFSGECRAPGTSAQPEETHVREVCNFGYGRDRCEQFPAHSAFDAIRFHVSSDSGGVIQIQYVCEKDCWPTEHGDAGAGSTLTEVLRRQADAFVESYVRRRNAS